MIQLIVALFLLARPDTTQQGILLTEKLSSSILKENRIGINPDRNIKIFLPPDYQNTSKSYPDTGRVSRRSENHAWPRPGLGPL